MNNWMGGPVVASFNNILHDLVIREVKALQAKYDIERSSVTLDSGD